MSLRVAVNDRVMVLDRTNFYAPGDIGKTRSLTPEGYLVCEGVCIARTGTMRYHKKELPLDADGADEITVTRSADEVFSAKTIASFEGKSVTVEHPNEFVKGHNYREHEIGTVHNVRRGTGLEDDMLVADLLIKDAEAIAYVNAERPQVSCGYDAEYEQTEPGHATQRNIIGNHVALVDRGRAGPRCAIRDAAQDDELAWLDGFDPKEKRDDSGRWAEEGRKQSEGALRHAKNGGDKAAITASENAHKASVAAKKSGLKTDHDAARVAHARAAVMNGDARRLATNKKDHESATSHRTAEQKHDKAMGAHAMAEHELGDEDRAKDQLPLNSIGDKSMKSRFADKFLRVMQAFQAKDAKALDHELSTDDHATDDDDNLSVTDNRIKDALDWIDEQRTAQRAAADAKAKQEADDAEADKKKKMKDTADALERSRHMGVLATSDAAEVAKHVMARAEILSPGIALPTGDAANAPDALPQLMMKAVKSAYATDAGKKVIEPFLLGATIDAVTLDNISGVFTGAAELMRKRNNDAHAPGAISVKDFGKSVTAQSLNEINKKFWAGRN